MRVVILVAALGLAVPALPVSIPVLAAEARVAGVTVAELMQATALDLVFDQFGAAIAASARTSDISSDKLFLSHWEAAAASAFNGPAMRAQLASRLDGQFTEEERTALGTFLLSDFGRMITGIERDIALLDADGQSVALAEGRQISSEAGAIRSAQLDELMDLMSAEISAAMAGQSVRALLVGMSVTHQRGDIEVPWQEIDAQVEAILPGLLTEHSKAQRALMAFAYRDLGDDELDRYIDFLRTAPARHFYAVAAYAVGQIAARSMASFGQTLAERMASVAI
jgi:hypothetical protein